MRILYFLFIISILAGCADNQSQEKQGGTIKMCLESEPMTYLSYETSDYYSATVFGQVMEGLVSIDPSTLKVKGQIASSWEINDDGTTYVFDIRNDVYFHPHEIFKSDNERLLTAEDIITTFELICSPSKSGASSFAYNHILKDILKGAEDFYDGKTKTISGISAKGNKLKIILNQKDDNFLYKLSHIQLSIHSKKIIKADLVEKTIGTGPFLFHTYHPGEHPSIYLAKNNNYYETDETGNRLPYLDSIKFIIQNRKLEQLDLFENKQIDLILALPTSKITKIVEGRLSDFNSNPPKLILDKNALLQTHYYSFNMEDPRFENPKVRQAFNYAVNREKIGRDILKNQYDELGLYGIIPPIYRVFRGYDFDAVKTVGYEYNPEKAKKLLAEAGYPNGKGFGTINLRFNIGDINSAVADELAQQIFQVLGINVNIDGSNFEQLTSDAVSGNGDLFKNSWIADYPNPENFLNNFHSTNIPDAGTNKGGLNFSKYNNPVFDNLLESAKKEDNLGKKMKLYSKAEVELIKNPPIIPLWYSGDLQIVHSSVRDLHFNSLSLFNFKKVYIKPWTAEEYQKETAQKNK
jgi:oligopeptide transport system substrate-binding protein